MGSYKWLAIAFLGLKFNLRIYVCIHSTLWISFYHRLQHLSIVSYERDDMKCIICMKAIEGIYIQLEFVPHPP